jgi:excisionase family DNA binding protein
LITVNAAAQLLGLHITTVYTWIKLGKLRAWRRARVRLFVSRAELGDLYEPVEVPRHPETPTERRLREQQTAQTLAEFGMTTGRNGQPPGP